MTEPRCPHCQTVLPEKATFCAACGNRIEGWSSVPVGAPPTLLPGGDEPTTNMQPTPSLLRAAALSKQPEQPAGGDPKPGAAEPSDSAILKSVKRAPIWLYLTAAAMAAGAAYYLALRVPPPPPPSAPPPVVAVAVAPTAPSLPSPLAGAPYPPLAPMRTKKSGHGRAHRIEPLQIPAKPSRSGGGGGGLPHKTVATDSKPLKSDAAQASSAVLQPAEDAPAEATPQTEDEMKKAAEASIDADGVRFVVKSHLSQVHACYERAFKESSPGGRVEIGFAITPGGTATRVRTETNSTGSESLAACLESRVKSWQFPRPVGGDYELIYPFVFAAGS